MGCQRDKRKQKQGRWRRINKLMQNKAVKLQKAKQVAKLFLQSTTAATKRAVVQITDLSRSMGRQSWRFCDQSLYRVWAGRSEQNHCVCRQNKPLAPAHFPRCRFDCLPSRRKFSAKAGVSLTREHLKRAKMTRCEKKDRITDMCPRELGPLSSSVL